MEDKLIMDNILTQVKNSCDLMMHGAIESSSPDVHGAFRTTLSDCLSIQNEIFAKMTQKGWYKQQCAEQQKIDQARQQFQGT